MKPDEITKPLGLEPKHFQNEKVSIPIINSHLYTTLGKQLFELYETYKIVPTDQRQLERLSYLLMSFTLSNGSQKPAWWKRILRKRRHGSHAKIRS
jgi:hypothetical protein